MTLLPSAADLANDVGVNSMASREIAGNADNNDATISPLPTIPPPTEIATT